MSSIQVIKPGFFDSIQDLGRFGFRDLGVPLSGVLDSYSSKLANAILNNDAFCAVLEMALKGPTLLFQNDTVIAITGANLSPKLNEAPINMQTKINVNAGDVLSFGALKSGCRAYLAVDNGFKTEYVLGSFSYYKGITNFYKLEKGLFLEIEKSKSSHKLDNAHVKIDKEHFSTEIIEAFKGPEFNLLSKNQQNYLFKNKFKIELNSRMGYQIETTIALSHEIEMLTSSVMPGTVQLTQSGKLIVLMKDCQTTGGYPRVLQLTEKGIAAFAQKNTFQKIYFKIK